MKFLLFTILLFATIFFTTGNVLAVSDSANINLQVIGPCNNNGICQSDIGETESNCPNDCGCNDNGLCESDRGETEQNCGDCASISGGQYVLNIYDIKAEIGFDSVEISWRTSRLALCDLFWGKTSEYEKEIISETTSAREHLVKLKNLDVQFTYHYKLSCSGTYDTFAETADYTFSLLSTINNVSNFSAFGSDGKIFLNWTNPKDSIFSGVRIIRSEKFYPLNAEDGIIVYDGYEKSFTDINLENGKRYYYTAFSYDKFRNYSSGAVASAAPWAQGEIIITPEEPPVVPPKLLEKITINDFNFYSEGQKLILKNEKTIEVENAQNIIVTIDYKKIFPEYSAIIFSFRSGNSIYSYLLKPDKEKTIYFATFQSPEKAGIYPIEIIFFDGYNNQVKKLDAELSVFKKEVAKSIFGAVCLNFKIILIFLWLILFLLVIILFLLIKRRKEKEKKQNVISTRN